MKKQKLILLAINVIFGSAVILSYIWGVLTYPDSVSKLWGNVPDSLIPMYTSWMFVAALGYFAFMYFILISCDADETRVARKLSYSIYYWIILLILIPSAIWMPLTFKMIITPSAVLWISIRVVLTAVAVGSISLIVAIIKTDPIKSKWSHRFAILGAVGFSIQTVLLDALIWTYFFPFNF